MITLIDLRGICLFNFGVGLIGWVLGCGFLGLGFGFGVYICLQEGLCALNLITWFELCWWV